MFPPEIDYYRAGSVVEAAKLLLQHSDSKVLAGGHSLIPVLKLRLAAPSALIDIGRISALRGIEADSSTIRIGALTTHSEIASSAVVRQHAPALAEAAGMIGDPAVRNRGTIGGNIAHADPASDLPQVLVCLGARFVVTNSTAERVVPAAEFFEGLMTTALGDSDIVTAVEVPAGRPAESSAYVKFAHPASRYSVIGAAAKVSIEDSRCTAASVVIGGVCPTPVRLAAVEEALVAGDLMEHSIEVAAAQTRDSLDDDEVLGDIYASAAYRKAVAQVWVRRALTAVIARSS